jgi:hypothetical protein
MTDTTTPAGALRALGFRAPDPAAVAGCGECRRLAGRRQSARAAGDFSAATDANVLLRAHQRQDHAEAGVSCAARSA